MLINKEKIAKAKQKIGIEKTWEIAKENLHLEKADDRNFKACCPFHNEDTPSFILNPKTMSFKCFGCGKSVDLIDIFVHSGDTYMRAVQKLFELADIKYSFGELGLKKERAYRYPHPESEDENKEQVYAYLEKRGISRETVDKADVTQDTEGNVVFNYFDENDVLCMCKYRPSRKIDKSKGDIKTWCQKDADTMPLLFHMNKINPELPLVISEGECFPTGTEVFTEAGWVKFEDYDNQKVLQISEDNGVLSGEFVTPIAYVHKKYDGNLQTYRVGGNYTSRTTENHNIVYFDKNGILRKRAACELKKGIDAGHIPTVVQLDGAGIPLTDDQIALYLAVSADCTIDIKKHTRHCRFSVKKDRKYERMLNILKRLDIPFFKNENVGEGYKYIGFRTPDWIVSKTLPMSWATDATLRQREYILNEMVFWDGNSVTNRNQTEYSSVIYENALLMQTLAHTSGRMSTIMKRRNAYGECYKVSILHGKKWVCAERNFGVKEHYCGNVYCVTTHTGMVLVRQEGHITVSGNCDTLSLIESGWNNVVSVPFGAGNTAWIEHNFDWLEQFNSIIICSDNDEAGVKMRKEVIPRLGSWRTKYIDIPKTIINRKTGHEVPIKDMNEVLYYAGKEAVLDLIEHAEDPGVPSIVNVSEIQDVDLDEMDGIVTGIKELDSEIMKLFYGTLTIVSGLPGAGKTSFLSQIACQSLEQNKPVWMFSREMPSWMEKNWLNYIMAGGHHINVFENDSGAKYYKIDPSVKDKINAYYDKRWFLYRDDWSNALDDLLSSMEDSVRKYGVKLLILDNLMTINIGSNENNDLQKQTDCVNKLIKFAMKYSVAVVLVAHPRKLQSGADIGIQDISGSANLTNLAHRTIGLRRIDKDKEKSNHDVVLTLIKDRMRGRSGKKINLYYDIPSRRFYTNESEYEYKYGWDSGTYAPLPYPHAEEHEVYGEV